jgi:hypothetical protein
VNVAMPLTRIRASFCGTGRAHALAPELWGSSKVMLPSLLFDIYLSIYRSCSNDRHVLSLSAIARARWRGPGGLDVASRRS